MDDIAQQLALRVSEKLPEIIQQLLREGFDPNDESLQLECRLTASSSSSSSAPASAGAEFTSGDGSSGDDAAGSTVRNTPEVRTPVATASFRLDHALSPSTGTPSGTAAATPLPPFGEIENPGSTDWNSQPRPILRSPPTVSDAEGSETRPFKRRRDVGSLRVAISTKCSAGSNISGSGGNSAGRRSNGGDRNIINDNDTQPENENDHNDTSAADTTSIRRLGSEGRTFPQRRKRTPDNPALQPSTLDKLIGGIWESLYSGVKMDPAGVIEQWQAIEFEGGGRPMLVEETDNTLSTRSDSGSFARMNILTRRISQTSRTCRSLEVIVQAHWVQCFEDRVAELTDRAPGEKAKKTAIAEACLDFHWTEKELRNKMAIWRGYHDIQRAGGWAALVFAGMGLYRFCKYRVSFTEETFQTLRALRHRFEVAADTLHPRWRGLLAIVGAPTERLYTGHPHDWVVSGPSNQALPLPHTYAQWDPNFSYTHLDASELDPEAWGDYDPRTVASPSDPQAFKCLSCGELQADDARSNACLCFPNLYGGVVKRTGGAVPVQVFRTPNGKNNGLLACCAFERGAAVGEFIGSITSGIDGLDVMVGQTPRALYQIWQGRKGNYTRFVNHSCQPNSQFERFVWRRTQRIVLVSKGIEAGEEITVDYSDTYWKNLDKKCLCERPNCRYKHRAAAITAGAGAVTVTGTGGGGEDARLLLPSPPEEEDEGGTGIVWGQR